LIITTKHLKEKAVDIHQDWLILNETGGPNIDTVSAKSILYGKLQIIDELISDSLKVE